MEKKRDFYAAYSSPYSGAFELEGSLTIPRPCSKISVDLGQVDYFYGQNANSFSLVDSVYSEHYKSVTSNAEYYFQNGTTVKDYFGWIDNENGLCYVQTNDKYAVSVHKTAVIGCNLQEERIEFWKDVNVTKNTAP